MNTILKTLHFAPDPAATTAGGAAPLGSPTLAQIPLDTTDHNVAPEPGEVTEAPAFDFNEITSTDHVKSQDGKLPSNTGKPTTTKKPQKFAEEASEQADPNEEPADEARRAENASNKPSEAETELVVEPAAEATPKPGEAQKLPATRDYTAFDAEEVKILKNMKNEHFAIMSKKLSEYKAAQTRAAEMEKKVAEQSKMLADRGTPESWLDHPEAFILSPEYKNLSSRYDALAQERAHYEDQLVAIKSGKPFQMIKGYDKAGNLVLSEPMEAGNAAEVHVMQLLQKYGAAETQLQSQVAVLQNTFKTSHTNAATAVMGELDKAINNLIPELRPVKESVDSYTGVIPPAFRSHPMTAVAAKQYGIIIQQAKMLAKYKEAETTQRRIKADVAAASPDTRALPRSNGSPVGQRGKTVKLPNGKVVPAEFDMADFTNGE